MTDPTPQAVTCLHCGKTVSEGIERDCYGSKTGMHNWVEPAEPSPTPPAPKMERPGLLNELLDALKAAKAWEDAIWYGQQEPQPIPLILARHIDSVIERAEAWRADLEGKRA